MNACKICRGMVCAWLVLVQLHLLSTGYILDMGWVHYIHYLTVDTADAVAGDSHVEFEMEKVSWFVFPQKQTLRQRFD